MDGNDDYLYSLLTEPQKHSLIPGLHGSSTTDMVLTIHMWKMQPQFIINELEKLKRYELADRLKMILAFG